MNLHDAIERLKALRTKGVETIGAPTTPNSINVDEFITLLTSTLLGLPATEDLPPAKDSVSGPGGVEPRVISRTVEVIEDGESSENAVSTGDDWADVE